MQAFCEKSLFLSSQVYAMPLPAEYADIHVNFTLVIWFSHPLIAKLTEQCHPT